MTGAPSDATPTGMPDAVIPRSINFPPDIHQLVVDYQRANGLKSFTQALLAIIAGWKASQGGSKR